MNDSPSIGYLVIADAAGVRLYHPDHALIGGHFSGGDEAPILRGDAPYISERRGTSEEQLRAFHAVCDENGAVLGFVMVSQSMRSIHNLQRTMFLHFSAICLAVLAIGMLLAYAISVNMRRILLGNEPPTFARMFLQREDILNHLSEGILAFDEFRNAAYKNSAGATFYPEASLPVEHPLFDCYAACKTSGVAQSAEMVNLDGKSYLVSAVPVEREGLFHIVMMILRDRTEIARLTEQVTGTNHIVDALRANTHEFMNKLHVISGLLQVGETEEAISYIGDTASDIENGYQMVIRQIQDRAVAALILGKMSRARELNIEFLLRKDSFLPAANPFLSTQELITVIGNLVENAFEAIDGRQDLRQTELFVSCDANGLSVSVDDTGRGMTEERVQRIYEGQYTTKGAGHGYGMRFIQEIVRARHGFLQIDSELHVGTSVNIMIGRGEEQHD